MACGYYFQSSNDLSELNSRGVKKVFRGRALKEEILEFFLFHFRVSSTDDSYLEIGRT